MRTGCFFDLQTSVWSDASIPPLLEGSELHVHGGIKSHLCCLFTPKIVSSARENSGNLFYMLLYYDFKMSCLDLLNGFLLCSSSLLICHTNGFCRLKCDLKLVSLCSRFRALYTYEDESNDLTLASSGGNYFYSSSRLWWRLLLSPIIPLFRQI